MRRLFLLALVLFAVIAANLSRDPRPRAATRRVPDPDAEKLYQREALLYTRFRIGEPQEIWGAVYSRSPRTGEPDGVMWYARDRAGREHHFTLLPDGRCVWEPQ